MENKTQDYQSEILAIIRGNTSPGVMRNKLEDYHENVVRAQRLYEHP